MELNAYEVHSLAIQLSDKFIEGNVINTNMGSLDYIFEYHNQYFNYAGLCGTENGTIEIAYDYFIPIAQMKVVDDPNYELYISDCIGFYDKTKDQIWNSFEPALIECGTEYIKKLNPEDGLKM